MRASEQGGLVTLHSHTVLSFLFEDPLFFCRDLET